MRSAVHIVRRVRAGVGGGGCAGLAGGQCAAAGGREHVSGRGAARQRP